MISIQRMTLALACALMPVAAFASAIHVAPRTNALGVSGSLYRASDFKGFEGTANLTLFGALDVGFSVQRSDMDDVPYTWAGTSAYLTGPTVYALGTVVTTYEPSVAYTFRLPRSSMLSLGAAYQWSSTPSMPLTGGYLMMNYAAYKQRGYRLSATVSHRYSFGHLGMLIPRLGGEYRWGRMKVVTSDELYFLDSGVIRASDRFSYDRDEFAFVAGLDAVIPFGRQQISIGPEVSLGQDTNSARIVMGYSLVSR